MSRLDEIRRGENVIAESERGGTRCSVSARVIRSDRRQDMKNGEENGRDREPHQKRHLRAMALAKNPSYRRYICDLCPLWSVDVLATDVRGAKEAFDAHDCKDYRQRDKLT